MKNVILIHGSCDREEYYSNRYPSLSNSHWFPWLQKQLLIKDIPTATPEIPDAFKPDYALWKKEFERFDITPETLLVGHSCGGGFLVRWLSENKDRKVSAVVLVAPWLDPNNKRTTDFFDFVVDPEITKRANKIIIFNSNDDDESIQISVRKIRQEVPAIGYKEFQGYGHFTFDDMQTVEFPELLSEVLV